MIDRNKLNKLLASYYHNRQTVIEEKANLKKAQMKVAHLEEARSILQAIAEAVQQQAHKQIADLVTRCLEAVFEEDSYEFRIGFEQKRGKTEAHLSFVRDGHTIDPVSASGGGVLDLASFAIRLSCLTLTKPTRRKLLLLDEPFRYVSAEYRDKVREILLTLSEELGIQVVMVTHNKELVCGKVIEL